MPRPEPVTCSVCTRPGTVYALDATGEPRPYCLVHGRPAGARTRCERCGRFDVDVGRTLILGHVVRPPKAKRAKARQHLLCPSCVSRMEAEQPDLFGQLR
jgi:hypothetical protein